MMIGNKTRPAILKTMKNINIYNMGFFVVMLMLIMFIMASLKTTGNNNKVKNSGSGIPVAYSQTNKITCILFREKDSVNYYAQCNKN